MDFGKTEQGLVEVWEAHTAAEFKQKSADAAIATMTDHPVLIHVPVGTGASGKEPLRAFYKDIFIPQMPPDIALELLTRTVAQNRIVATNLFFILRIRSEWTGSLRESSRLDESSSFPMWGSSRSRGVRSVPSTSTGTRRQFSCNWVSSMKTCRS